MASNFDDFKLAVEALSGGKNTVILDEVGMPSVMVRIPKYKMSQLISGGSENVHPAFMVNGVEKDVMYVGKFHDIVINDRAYSLPMKCPAAWVTFDQGVTYNRNKGKGWSLMPYALWCVIALWCRKNGAMPHGNNNFGSDSSYPTEVGIPVPGSLDNNKTALVYEGSGPASWYHDGTRAGIYGMNGSVWDRVAGMRLYNGEIQVIPYSNCFLSDASMAEGSSLWKAIDVSGNLVAPGSAKTLKWDSNDLTAGAVEPKDVYYSIGYADMTLDSSITTVPEIAKALLLYPDEPGKDYGGDYHWWRTDGEKIPYCGGSWSVAGVAGVFGVYASDSRSSSNSSIGLRSAYCSL